MQSNPQRSIQEATEATLNNLPRTSVLAVAVSEYDHFPALDRSAQDFEMMGEIFDQHPDVALYHERFTGLLNPIAQEFRAALLGYVNSRHEAGDILMLYFSGRGAISGRNRLYFCAQDTATSRQGDEVLRLSAVNFDDVLQTLTSCGVKPVLFVDLCFREHLDVEQIEMAISSMQDSLHRYHGGAYALIAASGKDELSFDAEFGGVFTRGLHSIVLNGLEDEVSRHMPILVLDALSAPLKERLAQDGRPLSRFYIAPDLPHVPIANNVRFQHTRESFAPYMKRIIDYLWNEGQPREAHLSEFIEHLGPGAYANHSKLSLAPWDLLQDGEEPGTRKLTDRGRQFAQGELQIPRKIVRDPESWLWIAEEMCEQVSIMDV